MKIIQFTAENVKRVVAVEIAPGGEPLVQITGRNAQGKSSTLDALGWLFSGGSEIDADPIRGGEHKAVIRADLGDIIVRRTLTRRADGKISTTLVVEGAEGARYNKPQQVVDSFMGALSFDPLEFMGAPDKEQFNMLRGFVKGVDFDVIDAANQADYDARTAVNRIIDQCRKTAASIIVPPDLPAERIDEAALLEQMTGAAATNGAIVQEKAAREARGRQRDTLVASAQVKGQRAEDLRRQAATLERDALDDTTAATSITEELAALPPLASPVEVADLGDQIKRAREVNAQIARRDERDRQLGEADTQAWEAEGLTEAMDARNKQKLDAIAATKMPVPGLSLGDGVVLFNGHPIKQASGAQQLVTSALIAMEMNPQLRVIRIRDGNSLDADNLKLLRDLAAERDFQVWIERVDMSGKVGFVIEDGRVVSTPVQSDLLGEAA